MRIDRHLTRCFLAGIVALLPITGLVLTIVTIETTLSESWLREQVFYFPGLGLLLALAIVYLIGLVVSTFVGRWFWSRIDRLLDRIPVLGQLYQTLKQILGYGEGRDAVFQGVVLLRDGSREADELGLVTNTVVDADGMEKLMVFVPGSPNPGSGRLLVVERSRTRPVQMSVHEALTCLVSVGKTPIPLERAR